VKGDRLLPAELASSLFNHGKWGRGDRLAQTD
jgi:hypothetical protein